MQWDELPEKCYRKTSERSIHKLHWGGKTQGAKKKIYEMDYILEFNL